MERPGDSVQFRVLKIQPRGLRPRGLYVSVLQIHGSPDRIHVGSDREDGTRVYRIMAWTASPPFRKIAVEVSARSASGAQ